VTTGEGGAALTNDDDLAEAMRLLRTHGVTRDSERLHEVSHGPWYYEQIDLGLNYRLTDIQAVLGTSQLKRLPAFLARRRDIAARYDAELKGLPLRTPWQHPDASSAYHLYPIVFDVSQLRGGRRAAFDLLRARAIGVQVHYIPVHMQPYYARFGFAPGDFPQAERYYDGAVSIPLFPELSDSDQSVVIDRIAGVCRELAR
jgi:dTDP-4-amino-4,6-dideoxygalactose transaminase